MSFLLKNLYITIFYFYDKANILQGERTSLKKKSCSCLGSLGLILTKEDIIKTVQ